LGKCRVIQNGKGGVGWIKKNWELPWKKGTGGEGRREERLVKADEGNNTGLKTTFGPMEKQFLQRNWYPPLGQTEGDPLWKKNDIKAKKEQSHLDRIGSTEVRWEGGQIRVDEEGRMSKYNMYIGQEGGPQEKRHKKRKSEHLIDSDWSLGSVLHGTVGCMDDWSQGWGNGHQDLTSG